MTCVINFDENALEPGTANDLKREGLIHVFEVCDSHNHHVIKSKIISL